MGHPFSSPNDLIFYFHHCNIDRLWSEWQKDGHQGPTHYPGPLSGEDEGHKLNDPMWPWVGSLTGYVSNLQPSNTVLPDYSGRPTRTPSDMLDIASLGYSYQ
jgi:tyrosinase